MNRLKEGVGLPVAVRPLLTTARECILRLYDYPGPCLPDLALLKALSVVRCAEGDSSSSYPAELLKGDGLRWDMVAGRP